MIEIEYQNKKYSLQESETVLDGLLREHIAYPHACKAGVCQSCLSELVTGSMDPAWQSGLDSQFIAQNYFLPCLCRPKENLTLRLANSAIHSEIAQITHLSFFSAEVLCVQLSVKDGTLFRAGQFIHLIHPSSSILRSYSIANLPHRDGFIELHIKLFSHGLMSRWLRKQASLGTSLTIQGPLGHCFYHNPTRQAFPIVLAGTGTGLAPLFGIALDALAQQHPGPIYLLHGGVRAADLYLDQALQTLASRYTHFFYQPCMLELSKQHANLTLETLLLSKLKGIESSVRVFICGPKETTRRLKMSAFLAGVPSSALYSDAFVSAK